MMWRLWRERERLRPWFRWAYRTARWRRHNVIASLILARRFIGNGGQITRQRVRDYERRVRRR